MNRQSKVLDDALDTLCKLDHAYYGLDAPLVSDSEYDKLRHSFESTYNDFKATYNETYERAEEYLRGVGIKVDRKIEETGVKHKTPMLSLNSCNKYEFLISWDRQVVKSSNYGDMLTYVVEDKLDGLAVSLIYEDCRLVGCYTRGTGLIGEDVTKTVIAIKNIPHVLHHAEPGTCGEVRGEVYIPKAALEEYNEAARRDGRSTLANCRNAAAGAIRGTDVDEVNARGCMFAAYWSDFGEHDYAKTHLQAQATLLIKHGFQTARRKIAYSIEEAIEIIKKTELERESLEYDIDGKVVKVNQFAFYSEIGSTSSFPKWAMAFKYQALEENTEVIDITYQVGMHGEIAPVLNVSPVAVGGVIISNVNMHNLEILKSLKLTYGSTVRIKRAGDVIPDFVRVVSYGDGGIIPIPTCCPECDCALVDNFCENVKCPGRLIKYILHATSNNALNIRGIGPVIAACLVNLGVVTSLHELLQLTVSDMTNNGVAGFKDATKICSNINKALAGRTEGALLSALAIPSVGKGTAMALTSRFGTIPMVARATEEQLTGMNGVGKCTAMLIREYFDNHPEVLTDIYPMFTFTAQSKRSGILADLVERLVSVGVDSEYLSGKRVCISGSFKMGSRDDVTNTLIKMGAIVVKGVSKNTDILLCGEGAVSSKISKADTNDIVSIYIL